MVATSARHEKQGSNRAANQFFSSLLSRKLRRLMFRSGDFDPQARHLTCRQSDLYMAHS
jgi:hypothetical protein